MRFFTAFCFLFSLNCAAQLSGTITIPGTYTSLATALNVLNSSGNSGPLTILVAATHTEVAPANGYTISAVGTSVSPILITGTSALQLPLLVAPANGSKTPSSAQQDGIVRLIGCDYVEIKNFELRDLNTASPQTMEFGIALFNASAADGCNHIRITNCKITLSASNNAAGNLPAVDGCRGIELVNALPSAHTSSLQITSQAGAHSNNIFSGNTIENCNYGIVAMGSQDASPYLNANTSNTIGAVQSVGGNTITNFGGGGTNASAGIRVAAQYQCMIANNCINSNNGNFSSHQGTLRGIAVNAAPAAACVVRANRITLHGGSTAAQVIAIENQSGASGITNNVQLCTNTITGCSNNSAVSSNFYGIVNSATVARLQIDSNYIFNNSTAAASGATYLIYNSAAVAKYCSLSNNYFGMKFNAVNTYQGNFVAINSANTATACVLKINGNKFSNIENTQAPGTGVLQFISNTADADTISIMANSWENIHVNHTGAQYMIQNMSSAGSALSVCNNSVSNYFRLQSGNTWFYYANSTSNALAVHTLTGNIISNVKYLNPGGSTFTGFQCTDGGLSPYPLKQIVSNTITAIELGNGAAFTGFSVSDLGSSGLMGSSEIKANTIKDVLAGEACLAINVNSPIASNSVVLVKGNVVENLASVNASASINGISLNAGGASIEFSNNKVGGLLNTSATGSVTGLFINSAGNYTIHHNLIGDLKAPTSLGQNRVNGIYVGTATQLKLYYNTVRIQASSTATLFGTNALFCSSTPSLELRNTILQNLSTASGSAITVAYRRSSTSNTSYSTLSNNNIFYAGTASSQNVLFYNGSTSYQTLTALQAAFAPRENLSLSSNILFRSASAQSQRFLHLDDAQPNVAESAGLPIAGYALDYDAEIIQGNAGYLGSGTAPDCGADEVSITNTICSTAPTYSFASSSATLCSGESILLSPLGNAGGTGILYQWQLANGSNAYQAISSATVLESTVSFTAAGQYYVRLISTCAATSASASSVVFSLQVQASPVVSIMPSQTVCAASTCTLQVNGNATNYYWYGPGAFTATTATAFINSTQAYHAGTYSLLVSNGRCVATVLTTQITVDVISGTVTANPPALCTGGACTLTASGNASNFFWNYTINSNTAVVTPSATSIYTLLATSSNSCTLTKTLQVFVTTPTIAAIGSSICLPSTAATIAVNAFAPSLITWYSSATLGWPLANTTTLAVAGSASTQFYAQAGLMYDKVLTTSLASGSTSAMQMFDLQAQTAVQVSAVEVALASTGTCNITIYARQGSFQSFSTTAAGWNLITTSVVTASSTPTLAYAKIDFDYFVPAQQTAAFAVAVNANSLVTSSSTANILNNDIILSQVKGGALFSVTQNQGAFQGALYYKKQACASTVIAVPLVVNQSPTLTIVPSTLTVCPSKQFTLSASGAASYTWTNGASTSSLSAAVPNATIFSVAGSSLGCVSQTSIAVQTHVVVTPTLSASNYSVCPNQTVQLSASGLQSYTWSTGPNTSSVNVSPASTTIYTVFGRDVNSCFSTNTITITTKVPAVISALTVPEKFCAGETVSLFAGGAISYTWLPSGVIGNSTTVNATSTLAIVVLGTGLNTCTASAFVVVEPEPCLSVSNSKLDDNLKIHPQPCTTFFELQTAQQMSDIQLMNTAGQALKHWQCTKVGQTYEVSEFSAGLYYLRVNLRSGQHATVKLVIQ